MSRPGVAVLPRTAQSSLPKAARQSNVPGRLRRSSSAAVGGWRVARESLPAIFFHAKPLQGCPRHTQDSQRRRIGTQARTFAGTPRSAHAQATLSRNPPGLATHAQASKPVVHQPAHEWAAFPPRTPQLQLPRPVISSPSLGVAAEASEGKPPLTRPRGRGCSASDGSQGA